MNKYELEKRLTISNKQYKYFDIKGLSKKGYDIHSLPFSIRILVENILRNMDGKIVRKIDLEHLLKWKDGYDLPVEIPYHPSRVLMQDFTGVPGVVDLAAMRDAVKKTGKDPCTINPLIPVDLVIDHSVQIDYYGTSDSLKKNVQMEYDRNSERYALLKWAQKNFSNFRVIPPGAGICHQVNLEYLGKVVTEEDRLLYPDTLIGTDSHTPMVAGIGVMAWGVGGIEAEAVLAGLPHYIVIPDVIGTEIYGKKREGVVGTDVVLYITKILREKGVVGKFIEYFGEGLKDLSVPDRATISNMSPEYGATMGYFPVDEETLGYLKLTSRGNVDIVERYAKENGFFRTGHEDIHYSDVVRIDLSKIEPSLAGPSRPQDKILLKDMKTEFYKIMNKTYKEEATIGDISRFNYESPSAAYSPSESIDTKKNSVSIGDESIILKDGSVVIAAITSCTNTSNPDVMIGAALVARKAVEAGLKVPPYVKTSLAPGSKVVIDYLVSSGLMPYLEALGFHTAAFGCTTCIGNSGPLRPEIVKAIDKNNLSVAAVLSGNRNFEARIHQKIRLNFLASPMLVVAFALTGHVDINLFEEPVGINPNGAAVFLKDIWPSSNEILHYKSRFVKREYYQRRYTEILKGDENWNNLSAPKSTLYDWNYESTYIRKPPFFNKFSTEVSVPGNISKARVLLMLSDSVTTDHISPAGEIPVDYPAGRYLLEKGVAKGQFNSYGSRRGNHEVMMRGTFANVRIKNMLVSPKEGGFTVKFPENEQEYIFDAAMKYIKQDIPLIVLAGKEYGTGSSRDWAAKGTQLLGVKAVIARSYERIHRSNLIGTGVLPLQFINGQSWKNLKLDGTELFDISGIADIEPRKHLQVKASKNGSTVEFEVLARLDTEIETAYFKSGGILQYAMRAADKNKK